MKTIKVFVCISMVVSILYSCESANELSDQAGNLRGTWVLNHSKSSSGVPATYNQFIVNNDNTYEINGFDFAAIEKGPMRSVRGDSFSYTIALQTEYPGYVGKSGYAKWTVSTGELTISFYSDASLRTYYVTFVGIHP